ncbi:MAG: AAA family ATPase [Acidimicrobiales bacterium]
MRQDLAERITSRRLTALLGPRRYGKTSLLRQVSADLGGVDHETVWVDLYEMGSMADVASAVDHGLAATKGRLRAALDALAGSMSFSLGVLGLELAKGPRNRPEPTLWLRHLLRMVVQVAQKQRLILVLDEFSGLDGVDHAAGVFRTELQHHYREFGIVFAGSQPSTMAMMFSDRAQPFFSQADLVKIGPLSDADVIDTVQTGFEATGRGVGPLAGRIADYAQGHPQRAMQLADAAWNLLEPGSEATDGDWPIVLEAVRASVEDGSERLFALLPLGHQKVLRVVANGGSVYGTAGGALSLPPGTAQGAVTALVGEGYLARDDDRWLVVDPLFADWIRRRFPM